MVAFDGCGLPDSDSDNEQHNDKLRFFYFAYFQKDETMGLDKIENEWPCRLKC